METRGGGGVDLVAGDPQHGSLEDEEESLEVLRRLRPKGGVPSFQT